MKFEKKYTTTEKKNLDPVGEKDKVVLSNDAYAIAEFIEKLINITKKCKK